MPSRLQIRRTKGYRKPEGAVYVGRPSQWGNPYPVSDYGEVAVEMFERELRYCIDHPGQGIPTRIRVIAESIENLRGKDLACWCPPGAVCHADVLLELANPYYEDNG